MTKIINTDNWNRKRQYEFFRQLDYPHFNISTSLDISNAHRYTRKQGISLFQTILYVTMRSLNAIPEFRYRIRGDDVIEYDIIHPSFTVGIQDDQFSFCTVNYDENIEKFFAIANSGIERVKQQPLLADEPGRDDLVYISCLPYSLQAHHALADGFHAGKFFNLFQEIADNPETLFNKP